MKQINVTVPKINMNVPKVNMPDVKEFSAKAMAYLPKMPKLPVTNAPEFISKKALKSVEIQVGKVLNDPEKRETILKYAEHIIHTVPATGRAKKYVKIAQMVADSLTGKFREVNYLALAIFCATSGSKYVFDFIPINVPQIFYDKCEKARQWSWKIVEADLWRYDNLQTTDSILYS